MYHGISHLFLRWRGRLDPPLHVMAPLVSTLAASMAERNTRPMCKYSHLEIPRVKRNYHWQWCHNNGNSFARI